MCIIALTEDLVVCRDICSLLEKEIIEIVPCCDLVSCYETDEVGSIREIVIKISELCGRDYNKAMKRVFCNEHCEEEDFGTIVIPFSEKKDNNFLWAIKAARILSSCLENSRVNFTLVEITPNGVEPIPDDIVQKEIQRF